jgi:hypothetical protein
MYSGRMFLTENYLCFHSDIIGTVKKIIKYSEIKEINKKKSLGVFPNAIKIVTDHGEKLFFISFPNRNTSYDCIYALWKNMSKYA